MCRSDLGELTEFVRIYRETLATARISARFEALMENVPPVSAAGEEAPPRGIVLAFTPYREPLDTGTRLAAATEPLPAHEPLRFCSADGRYILREFIHPEGEKHPSSFYLVAEQDLPTEQVELEIDGRIHLTGPGGKLDLEPAGPKITRETRILIRAGNRN